MTSDEEEPENGGHLTSDEKFSAKSRVTQVNHEKRVIRGFSTHPQATYYLAHRFSLAIRHSSLVTVLSNSRSSHDRARFQSPLTVRGETFNTLAISSSVSPPKYRSSTTLLCRGSQFGQFGQSIIERHQLSAAFRAHHETRHPAGLRPRRPRVCPCFECGRNRSGYGASPAPRHRRNGRGSPSASPPARPAANKPRGSRPSSAACGPGLLPHVATRHPA